MLFKCTNFIDSDIREVALHIVKYSKCHIFGFVSFVNFFMDFRFFNTITNFGTWQMINRMYKIHKPSTIESQIRIKNVTLTIIHIDILRRF